MPISNCINSDVNSNVCADAVQLGFAQSSHRDDVSLLAASPTASSRYSPRNRRLNSPHWFQGTADAVRQVLPHIRDWGIDTLLILSGDHLYRMDYRKFLARHYETNADVTDLRHPHCARDAAERIRFAKD